MAYDSNSPEDTTVPEKIRENFRALKDKIVAAASATIADLAAAATKLATAVNINGVSFDGSADITISTTESDSDYLLSTNGYQKLSSGLILQWGTYVNTSSNIVAEVTLPIEFPNSFLAPWAAARGSKYYTGNASVYVDIVSNSEIRLVLDEDNSGPASDIFYFAIGY